MACVFPLINVDANDPEVLSDIQLIGLNCALRCTGTMVDAEEVENYYTLQVAVGGVSLFLALFCNLTWGLFSVKSKQKMTFWVTFASVCVTSFTFFPLIISGSGEETWCLDDHTPRRQNDGISGCVLQGMAIIFFGLSLCAWWWCSCFDLFTKLFLRKRNIEGYLVYYHIFSWGLPIVCTLAILFTGEFGYEQPRLWCFLSPEAPAAFEYVFFYGWVGALWITGTILFGLTVFSIFTGKSNSGKNNIFKKLSIYRVPLMFVLIFSFFWAIFFGFSVITNAQEDELVNSAKTWIDCLVTDLVQDILLNQSISFPNPAFLASPEALAKLDPQPEAGIAGCGDVQPGRLSPALFHIAVLALAGNGALIFLIFGVQKQNFTLWSRYISSRFNPNSVRPKMRGGKAITEKQYSTYQELRIGIARFTIYCCEKFAGIEGEEAHSGPKKPIITKDHSDYNPKFVDNQTELLTGRIKQIESMEAANYPRISYPITKEDAILQKTRSHSREDPFPAPGTHDTMGESILDRSPPPPNQGDLTQFYSSRQHHSNTNWSDVFDDPLWGVNVEF